MASDGGEGALAALSPKARRKPWKPVDAHDVRWLMRRAAQADEPLAEHPIQMHAHRLLLWLDEGRMLEHPPILRGRMERGIFGWALEQAYDAMCHELWWRPVRWEGKNGVAEHFRRLTKSKKGYRYTVEDGVEKRLVFYPVPEPAPVSGREGVKRTPEPTPKRKSPKRAKGKGGNVVPFKPGRRVA